jgi:Protein of unknown function (DUF2442)
MTRTKAVVTTTESQINTALARASKFEKHDRRIARAEYERKNDLVTLHFDDGIRVSIPRAKLQGLQGVPSHKVRQIEIVGAGTGLHWPALDVDHYVPGLLNRVFGTSHWMATLGKRGGSSNSEAKASAARLNGRKGGRPRRVA